MGLPGIPQPVLFGWKISSHLEFLFVVACLCALTLWVVRRIVRSPFGRVLKAIREDEVFAQALGKHVAAYKVWVFVIGAQPESFLVVNRIKRFRIIDASTKPVATFYLIRRRFFFAGS